MRQYIEDIFKGYQKITDSNSAATLTVADILFQILEKEDSRRSNQKPDEILKIIELSKNINEDEIVKNHGYLAKLKEEVDKALK